jgi:hypothetical protein
MVYLFSLRFEGDAGFDTPITEGDSRGARFIPTVGSAARSLSCALLHESRTPHEAVTVKVQKNPRLCFAWSARTGQDWAAHHLANWRYRQGCDRLRGTRRVQRHLHQRETKEKAWKRALSDCVAREVVATRVVDAIEMIWPVT